jgi:hypothetical protein
MQKIVTKHKPVSKQKEINVTLEKGSVKDIKIFLKDRLNYRELNRYIATKDRWIRFKRQNYRESTDLIEIQIISRGLFAGYHRGILTISAPNERIEYIIHLFVIPKTKRALNLHHGASN